MATFLTYASVIVAAAIVVVLVVYLVLIILALWRAGNHLAALAGGLQQVVDNTEPLEEHLTTINGALTALDEGLDSVDDNLVDIAEVLELR
ncbi:MAG: hypothetical protein AAF702_27680 [Chloroflexota bacterium]